MPPPLSISVQVSTKGAVRARCWHDNTAKDGAGTVDLTGLDGRVLRVFERWLMDYERTWLEHDVRVFGQLLHRRLFTPALWHWIEQKFQASGKDVARLQLEFPADAASSRLASLPWEYLCAPDRPQAQGQFLVMMPQIMLSRTVPGPALADVASEAVRILPVVGDADNAALGTVEYDEVLEAVDAVGQRVDFEALDPVVEPTVAKLQAQVDATRPHVVHYIGHGRYRDDTASGALALRADDGGTAWVEEDVVVHALCRHDWAPTIVVLHACEGGRTDFEYRHAGLAGSLVRSGVQCVVAMQYPVTNTTAVEFSTTLYDALGARQPLDTAVQTARVRLWDMTKDARLLGVPMVYQRDATPLLAEPAGKAD